MDIDGSGRPFYRTKNNNNNQKQQQKVCYGWLQGKCTRYPCPYLHTDLPANTNKPHQGFGPDKGGGGGLRNNSYSNNTNSWGRDHSKTTTRNKPINNNSLIRKTDVCKFWAQGGKCKFEEFNCKFLHRWSTGDCFLLLTKLDGHQKAITGITLPFGSDKLYTGSQDGTVRFWDCQSGQVAGVVKLEGDVGCMLSEGPWVFVGITNLVKAWNIQTTTELSLNGPVGQVYSLVVGNDLLFAGTQDGTILAWKFNVTANCFEPAASLIGHTLAVVTLIVGGSRMYSGSMDHSIRVWSLETLQCLQTLSGHTDVVMYVLCWDQFLLSASLDKTVKVWATADSGNLEVTYTHTEEHGIITLCGMHDSEAKPVLMCSCNDNTIRVYNLPSFSERAKIFSKKEVRSIQMGPGGLFFTGEASGQLQVWQWSAEPAAGTKFFNSNFYTPNQIHHHPFYSSSSSNYFPPKKVLFLRKPLIGLANSNESRLTNFFSSQPQILQCWNCANASPLLFCESCRSVQPVDHSLDYFLIFGLRREYNVEVEELEGKYKDWQKKLHPDLVHTKSQKEREYAADQSAQVTNAYRTLCDPLARAVYMVKLQGVPHDIEETITDPELLAEIMELREDVEEAEGTEALNQIQSQLKEKLLYWSKSFEDAFSSKKYDDALASINRMTYYRRANEEIVKKQ